MAGAVQSALGAPRPVGRRGGTEPAWVRAALIATALAFLGFFLQR